MEDDELVEIRRQKMQALMRQAAAPRVEEPLANGLVNILTEATFWQTIAQTTTALVDFFGEWCGPCKALAPMMIELAAEWKGKIFFGKIDVDRSPRIAAQFQVQSVPMVIAFRHSQPVASVPGLRSLQDYDVLVERLRSA